VNIKDIIIANNFHYKKSLGQNFITDRNLLDAIVKDGGVGKDDVAVEIGVGAGGLTAALSATAKKVYGFEVDRSLEGILAQTLKGCENTEIIFRDVLKMSDEEFKAVVKEPFHVVANLPYYITMPLIMRFLESGLCAKSITVMVQKEVAERITARHNTKEYSAVTVAVKFYADAEIKRAVSKNMFFPVPKVDSALLKLTVVPNKYGVADKEKFLKLTSAAFSMRRKTLANNLEAAFGTAKTITEKALERLGYPPNARGETLPIEDFIRLYDLIF
jgi:16S rRNA (adenine1518-N6/adenine1519-N6)-dimethyltransferase